jgi:hypothetical protein
MAFAAAGELCRRPTGAAVGSVTVERLALQLESVAVDDANGRAIQRDPWGVKSLPNKQSQCRT